MAGRRRDRTPITVTLVWDDDAPQTEADWTPEQRDRAIRALGIVLGTLIDSRPAPTTNTPEPEQEAA